MTEDEHQKLIEEYGEVAAKEMILMLDDYKGASGKNTSPITGRSEAGWWGDGKRTILQANPAIILWMP